MIESTTYVDSKNQRRLVPQFTLSPFEDSQDEWTAFETIQILKRAKHQFFGNMNHNMVNFFINVLIFGFV